MYVRLCQDVVPCSFPFVAERNPFILSIKFLFIYFVQYYCKVHMANAWLSTHKLMIIQVLCLQALVNYNA